MDYLYIRAWGRFMMSTKSYIDQQVAKAIADNAPEKAIHKQVNGIWATFDDIKPEGTRNRVQAFVDAMQAGRSGK